MSGARLLSWRGENRLEETDMADLIGMADARFAVEVAAAGGHHLLLSGPKGAGKTSIAERIPGILPDLTRAESLELTAVHSLAGILDPGSGMIVRPPYSAPHHDASKASLIGGGSGAVRPGAVSQAHAGVLFLDEFPLFRSDVIEALRQPLESGDVTIARQEESVTLPARGMVVLACNPCPCGDYSPSQANRCSCRPAHRRDYQLKVTGPVADRVDIVRHLAPLGRADRADRFSVRESSAQIRERVTAARERQARRYDGFSWRLNGHAPGPDLREHWPLDRAGQASVDDLVYRGKLSRRGATRVHRLAGTVADLRDLARPGPAEVDAAIRLRVGDSLLVAMLERAA
jgi:magnesium chelatase family protein